MSDTPTDEEIRAEAEQRKYDECANDEQGDAYVLGFEAGTRWAREQTAERVTDMFQPPTYEERYGQTAPTVAQFIEKWESVGPPGGDTHDAYSIGWCNARNAVLHDVRGIAPTVAPSVASIMTALAGTGRMPEWWGGAEFRRTAEAIAAAVPRRSEAEVKAEALEWAAEYLRKYDPCAVFDASDGHKSIAVVSVPEWLEDRADRLREGGEQ